MSSTRQKYMKACGITVLFAVLIIIMTYPLAFKITTHMPGFFSTDEPYGSLWDFWRINHSFKNHISLKSTYLISYPFGINYYQLGCTFYIWLVFYHILAIFTSPVLSWNIQVFCNFLLSGVFTYALIFYLTRDKLSSLLGGIIFAFCPYQAVRGWQHLGLTYNQWLPLCLLGAFRLKDPAFDRRKTMVFFLISILLVFSFDYTITYFTVISLSGFFIYLLFYNWRGKVSRNTELLNQDFIYLKKVIIVGAFALVMLFPQISTIVINRLKLSSSTPASAHNPYHRSFEDLFYQSARPLSYFLPAIVHPIFGKFTEKFIGSDLYGKSVTEHTLYLGWVPLGLALIVFKRWKKNRKLRITDYGLRVTDKEDFYIGFFIFLSIVAWLFSQPPWWKFGPIKVFMPSFFMYKILPMYRAYCRFGIVLMFAVAVLAGFGLKFIIAKRKAQSAKLAITALCCGLVLFEFCNWPPYKVIDVSKAPLVYSWLKQQPGDFAIAEYPLDAATPNEKYKFYQTKHEKKIINGTLPGTYANKAAKTITQLSNPATAGILKWMGVKYVLVHKENYLKTELIEDRDELNKIPHNPGLKLIQSFPLQNCPDKDIMCVQETGP
ncbi:MAG: hypothetical protein V2A64_00590, partial [Candidatus Omnitrophota bacterium]